MIAVTGAAGFIGRHLVADLRGGGDDVVGLDRRPGADIVADLVADDIALDVVRSADAVFHLAGAGGVRRSGRTAEATWWRDNVLATDAVLRAVPRSTPLVVASSSSVYGGTAGRACREGDPLRPRGGYARSKLAVERLTRRRLAAGGHVAVARPFTVAGEHQRPDMALARWIAAAAAGEPLRVFGSPARRRDVTDVRQVVAVLVAMARREVLGSLNVGTGTSFTLREMVDAVVEAVGPAEIVVERAHRDEVEASLADTGRCRRLLGFVPVTDLAALVRRQAAAAGAAATGGGPAEVLRPASASA
ncbi:MAG TPA: NAD(P)-dependent oxidoreductase [Acidimicrobiales bacterium]|nr:NAD(P)-dependent oxidoreductase [Acidimicrobiales bacterium]